MSWCSLLIDRIGATDHQFQSSVDYIITSSHSFNYAFYYNQFCDGFTRDQTRSKLKSDLEICSSAPDVCDAESLKWINEQVDNDVPLEKTLNVDAFWLALLEKQDVYRSAIYEQVRKKAIKENMHEDAMINMGMPSQNEQLALNHTEQAKQTDLVDHVVAHADHVDHADHAVIESDTLITFNDKSIASILKSEGKCLFSRYSALSEDEQTRCGYCLSGILNVSSDIQQYLFTPDQWTLLVNQFKSTVSQHLSKPSVKMNQIIGKTQKLLDDDRCQEAYYAVLAEMKKSSDQWLLKILAHIFNCFIERDYMFKDSQSKIGHDYMSKIWYEFFELMFGGQDVKVNWGQSASDTLSQARSTNSSNNNSTIVCKVGGEAVSCIRNVRNESNCPSRVDSSIKRHEAALAIESKCMLDGMLRKQALQHENHAIQSVLINGTSVQVFSLSLVDSGLYISSQDFDLSLPSSPSDFAAIMPEWISKVISFRGKCLLNSKIYISAADSFIAEPSVASSWTRGTFMFPSKGQAVKYPDNFLPSTSQLPSQDNNDVFKSYALDDGTNVKERNQQQKQPQPQQLGDATGVKEKNQQQQKQPQQLADAPDDEAHVEERNQEQQKQKQSQQNRWRKSESKKRTLQDISVENILLDDILHLVDDVTDNSNKKRNVEPSRRSRRH
ncbi:hypothetical protein MBANPS3_006529 [Mucor bainieri]